MKFLKLLVQATLIFVGSAFTCFAYAGEPGSIYGDWDIQSINDQQLPDDIDSNLTFSEDDRLGAKAGCNMVMASFRISQNKIDIGQAAATRKMCSEDIMEYESMLFVALDSIVTFSLEKDLLIFTNEKGNKVLQASRKQ